MTNDHNPPSDGRPAAIDLTISSEAAARIRASMDEVFERLRRAGHFPVPPRPPRRVLAWRGFLRFARGLNHPTFSFDSHDWSIGIMKHPAAWTLLFLPTLSITWPLDAGERCTGCGRVHT